MSYKVIIRIIPMLLLFVSAAYAAAPGWVAKGAVLDYSVGSDTVTFTVTGRTSEEIKMTITTDKARSATENASLTSGQFWFDSLLLKDASIGKKIAGDFSVAGKGEQTFAGTEWDTVTLEATISDSKTTRIYDSVSGLLLKQTVDAAGAPTVMLTKYTVPDFNTAAPEAPQPVAETASEPDSVQANQTDQPEPEEEAGQPQVTTNDTVPAADTSGETEPEAPAKTQCLSGAVLLALAGFAFARN